MEKKLWHSERWPQGVPYDVSGYQRPVFDLLDQAADQYPDQTYTIFQDAQKSFAQVRATANRVANFLAEKGIGKGDRVAVFLPNLPHYPEIFFGVLKAGAVCVTCNPMYTADELNFQLKDSGAKAMFVMDHPLFYPTAVKAMAGSQVQTLVVCNIKSYLPWIKGFLGGASGQAAQGRSDRPQAPLLRPGGGRGQRRRPCGLHRPGAGPGPHHLHRRHHRGAKGGGHCPQKPVLRRGGGLHLGAHGTQGG